MKPDFAKLAKHFQFEGDFLDAVPYGSGHINDTYAARFKNAGSTVHRYLLQRINHEVFKSPAQVMQNIERVTAHLRKKIVAAGGDPDRETLNLIPAADGRSYFETKEGDHWRAYILIEGTRTYEVVKSLAHVYHAGRAFGRFQELLADLSADQLYETIPDFHHTPKRFDAFVDAVERDVKNRAHAVQSEIAFIEQREGDTSILLDLLKLGELPQRITHNDTKFNNVMIDDETGEGICVIDLDTVMPGLSLYDFGDVVRSGANSAAEDERDLSQVSVDLQVLEQLARGYLESTQELLTPAEIDYLPFAAKLMTFECGIRFLTDHLNGDVYFRVHRPHHNLDRCRTQLKLVQDMETRFDRMEAIVEQYRRRFHGHQTLEL